MRATRGNDTLWSAGLSSKTGVSGGAGIDRQYVWWGFRGGEGRLIVERRIPVNTKEADGDTVVQTEVYAPDDGRLLHRFPQQGPGKLLRAATNRMLAVVVAKETKDASTLELWSIPQFKSIAQIGQFPANIVKKTGQVGGPTITFSPDDRWLLASDLNGPKLHIW
ncbi:MAG: hypothetical protein IH991_04075, partial [Planctomycetes bacterium]|nr:hypothetical protein [Planctomycetota bacterium]